MSTPVPNAARSRLVCLVLAAVGGGVALLASAQPWASGRAAPGPGLPALAVSVAGRQAAPAVGALALVALAGIVALFATRGIARLVVAALLLVAGLGLTVAALVATRDPAQLLREAPAAAGLPSAGPREVAGGALSLWPWAAAASGLLIAAAGLLALGSRGWPGMSARYERAGGAAADERAAPVESPDDRGAAASGGPVRTEEEERAVRDDLASRARWDSLDAGVDPTDDRRSPSV
ncbi:MAG: Trp biosynthesis-associated membrane protein [Actinomycetales bacterium]